MSKNSGIILSPDDVSLNDLITVHSAKFTDDCVQIMGVAMQIKAINLPYLACHVLGGPPCIMDTRYYNFMRISREYADALLGKFVNENESVQTGVPNLS